MREGLDLEGLTAHGHALLLYDQRGAGNSELVSTPSRLTLASHVGDLEAVRRHFKLSRLKIIGVSWGAAIGLHYAVTHPAAVDRLVFLSPMPPTGLYFIQRFARLDSLRSDAVRARLRQIDSLWSIASDSQLPDLCRASIETSGAVYQEGGPESRQALGDVCDYPARVLRHRRLVRVAALTPLGVEYDFSSALRRVNRPVLVVEGEKSKVPLEATRFWARHAPRARLLLVPGAGHRTWLDQPARVFEALHAFLEGEWPDGAQEVQAE